MKTSIVLSEKEFTAMLSHTNQNLPLFSLVIYCSL